MKRRKIDESVKASGPVHMAAVETDLLGALTQIVAHLTHTRYDDGTARQTGTISVRTQGSLWICEARDWDAAARLRAAANTLDDALVLLDTLLGADTAPWEPDVYLQGKGRKK